MNAPTAPWKTLGPWTNSSFARRPAQRARRHPTRTEARQTTPSLAKRGDVVGAKLRQSRDPGFSMTALFDQWSDPSNAVHGAYGDGLPLELSRSAELLSRWLWEASVTAGGRFDASALGKLYLTRARPAEADLDRIVGESDARRVRWANLLGHRAPGSTHAAFTGALDFLEALTDVGEAAPPVSGDGEGSIVFGEQGGPRRWTIHIEDDGEYFLIIVGPGAASECSEIEDARGVVDSLIRFRSDARP